MLKGRPCWNRWYISCATKFHSKKRIPPDVPHGAGEVAQWRNHRTSADKCFSLTVTLRLATRPPFIARRGRIYLSSTWGMMLLLMLHHTEVYHLNSKMSKHIANQSRDILPDWNWWKIVGIFKKSASSCWKLKIVMGCGWNGEDSTSGRLELRGSDSPSTTLPNKAGPKCSPCRSWL